MSSGNRGKVIVGVHVEEEFVSMVKELLTECSLDLQVQVVSFSVQDALSYLTTHSASVLIVDLDNLLQYQPHLRNLLFEFTAKVPTLFLLANTSALSHLVLPPQKNYLMKPVVRQVLLDELTGILLVAATSDSAALDTYERSRLEFFSHEIVKKG